MRHRINRWVRGVCCVLLGPASSFAVPLPPQVIGVAPAEKEANTASKAQASVLLRGAALTDNVRLSRFAPYSLEPPGERRYEFRHADQVWLVAETTSHDGRHRLCVSWLAPNGQQLQRECQPISEGEARLVFASPDTRSWPVGEYSAQLSLEGRGIGSIRPRKLTELEFVAGRDSPYRYFRAPARESALPRSIPHFAWPPPRPTSRTLVERTLLAEDNATLGSMANRLEVALTLAGYSERSFFAAPNGFVLATRLEQIEFDGTPRPDESRWSHALPRREIFSLRDYMVALFTAPEGHYRVIVFVVSDEPFAPSDEDVTESEARGWLHGGVERLPPEVANIAISDEHACSALVYQFKKQGHHREPILHPDGAPAADMHLVRSGILNALTR